MRKLASQSFRRLTFSALALSILLAGIGLAGHNYSVTPSALAQAAAKAPRGPANWEPTIQKFEESDKANPPKPGMILFTGSSSFVRWSTLTADMAPLNILNRAFGGSQFNDLNQWVERDVIAYHPKAVVVYEGDNDLDPSSPKTPEMVFDECKKFVTTVRSELPDTWIYVVSIKPSKLRWKSWDRMQAANKMMEAYTKTQKQVQYIDVTAPMFDKQGNLPEDLFVADGLHPTPKLYAMWTAIIKPILLKRFAPKAKESQG
jgi:lysophospholipase L1-like esterase